MDCAIAPAPPPPLAHPLSPFVLVRCMPFRFFYKPPPDNQRAFFLSAVFRSRHTPFCMLPPGFLFFFFLPSPSRRLIAEPSRGVLAAGFNILSPPSTPRSVEEREKHGLLFSPVIETVPLS